MKTCCLPLYWILRPGQRNLIVDSILRHTIRPLLYIDVSDLILVDNFKGHSCTGFGGRQQVAQEAQVGEA